MLPTPIGATYILFFIVLTILFYLEGLMIAIVATQYWDKGTPLLIPRAIVDVLTDTAVLRNVEGMLPSRLHAT